MTIKPKIDTSLQAAMRIREESEEVEKTVARKIPVRLPKMAKKANNGKINLPLPQEE